MDESRTRKGQTGRKWWTVAAVVNQPFLPMDTHVTRRQTALPVITDRLMFAMAIMSIVFRPLLPLHVRCISTSATRCARTIRRRVTRLPSDYCVYAEELEEDVKGPNDRHQMKLMNRNPRNLEQLSLKPKPFGFELEATSHCYWNK